jgi:AraC-like DNA-binding protein
MNDVLTYLKTHRPVFMQGFRHEVTRAVWPFHNHHEFEIAFFTRGRATVTFPDGAEMKVEPEGFTMIPAGLPHQTTLELPAETAAILVQLQEPVPALFEQASYIRPHKDPHLIADVMYLTAPPPKMTPLQKLEFDLCAAVLLTRLAQRIGRTETELDEGTLYVGMAQAYIQRHFSSIRNLEEIAAHVGISYHHLRHLFKKHRQMSLKQFLANLRINHARQLLMLSRMLVKEIAESCGFESERHFSMYFKKCEGVSPQSYRKCHARQYAENFSEKPLGTPESAAPVSQTPAACLGIKTRRRGKK